VKFSQAQRPAHAAERRGEFSGRHLRQGADEGRHGLSLEATRERARALNDGVVCYLRKPRLVTSII
jgi:hypothetical protein